MDATKTAEQITRMETAQFRAWLKRERTELVESSGVAGAHAAFSGLVESLQSGAKRLNPASESWKNTQSRLRDIYGVISEMNMSESGDSSDAVGVRPSVFDDIVDRLAPIANHSGASLFPSEEGDILVETTGSTVKAKMTPLDDKGSTFLVFREGTSAQNGCVVTGPKKAIDVAMGIARGALAFEAEKTVENDILRESVETSNRRRGAREIVPGAVYRFCEDHFQPKFRGLEFRVKELNENGDMLVDLAGDEIVILAHEAEEHIHGGQSGSCVMIETVSISVADDGAVTVSGAKSVSVGEQRAADPVEPEPEEKEPETTDAAATSDEETDGAETVDKAAGEQAPIALPES